MIIRLIHYFNWCQNLGQTICIRARGGTNIIILPQKWLVRNVFIHRSLLIRLWKQKKIIISNNIERGQTRPTRKWRQNTWNCFLSRLKWPKSAAQLCSKMCFGFRSNVPLLPDKSLPFRGFSLAGARSSPRRLAGCQHPVTAMFAGAAVNNKKSGRQTPRWMSGHLDFFHLQCLWECLTSPMPTSTLRELQGTRVSTKRPSGSRRVAVKSSLKFGGSRRIPEEKAPCVCVEFFFLSGYICRVTSWELG